MSHRPRAFKITAKEIDRMRRYRAHGMTLKEIGELFGVTNAWACILLKHERETFLAHRRAYMRDWTARTNRHLNGMLRA